jgi:hypothetical protein
MNININFDKIPTHGSITNELKFIKYKLLKNYTRCLYPIDNNTNNQLIFILDMFLIKYFTSMFILYNR